MIWNSAEPDEPLSRKIYALEGTVHSGKTTLLRYIQNRHTELQTLDEYIEYTTSGFPSAPTNLIEASEAVGFFLDIDRLRSLEIRQHGSVILDRSVLSILGYEFAIDKMFPSVNYWDATLQVLRDQDWTWPEVCVYLKIDDPTLAYRHSLIGIDYQPILLNSEFNQYLRQFYEFEIEARWPNIELLTLDGIAAPAVMFEAILSHMESR
jgi:thymidylate kinase